MCLLIRVPCRIRRVKDVKKHGMRIGTWLLLSSDRLARLKTKRGSQHLPKLRTLWSLHSLLKNWEMGVLGLCAFGPHASRRSHQYS
jgi:hypothetical protein